MLSHIGRNKRLPIYGQTEGDLDVDLDAIGVLTRRKRQKWCPRQGRIRSDTMICFCQLPAFTANETLFVLALLSNIFGCEINEL